MDTRILLDYIQRRPWLWAVVAILTSVVGFQSSPAATSLLVPAFLYVTIVPMSTELGKQGPVWIQQHLPVRQSVLARTMWGLMVVVPVIVIAASMLPAYCYGVITGSTNLASANLFRIIATGLLFTSAYSIFVMLVTFWWMYKLLRIFALIGIMLMGAGLMKLLLSEQYWNALSLRPGMIVVVVLLMMVSYIISPQIFRATGRNPDTPSAETPGQPLQIAGRTSMINMMLESPAGRALMAGLWLLIAVVCFNLFGAIRNENRGFFEGLTSIPAMAPIIVMLSLYLWIVSSVHSTSFRAMACLPISRVRQTLTYLSQPLIAVAPLVLFMTITVIFTTTEIDDVLQSALVMLYSLMAVHVGLAFHIRFGKIAAIISLVLLTQVLMMRVIFQGRLLSPELSGLEIPAVLGVILAAGLWTHWTLSRNENVYRQQAVSAESGSQWS